MIPQFQCTEDALDWGRTASIEQIEAVKLERLATLKKVESLEKEGHLQKALDLSFCSQFLREAIESWRKNHEKYLN